MADHELSRPSRGSSESSPAGNSPGRVLLVEDDPEVRSAFATFLSRQSYDVQVVASAQEALMVLDRERFDVVVSDIRMPGMDGLQLLSAVRRIDPLIPVVLMTGNPELDRAIAAVEQGALRYLTKPVDLERCAVVIAKAVRLSRRSQRGRYAVRAHDSGRDVESAVAAPAFAPAPLAENVADADTSRGADASRRSADRFFAAHQFLSKPFNVAALRAAVERVSDLQKMLADEAIRAVIGKFDKQALAWLVEPNRDSPQWPG